MKQLECRCGVSFVRRSSNQIHCSKKCSNDAHYARTVSAGPQRDYSKYQAHSVSQNIALDRDMVATVKEYAVKEGQSFSAAVRDLLEWAIEDHIECRN